MPSPRRLPDQPASRPVEGAEQLRQLEESLRRAMVTGPPPAGPGGADPSSIDGFGVQGVLVTLSATDELLWLDASVKERARVKTARGAQDVAVWQDHAFVIGSRDSRLLEHALSREGIGPPRVLYDQLASPSAVGTVQAGQSTCLVIADDADGELVILQLGASRARTARRYRAGERLIGVDVFEDLLVTRSLIQHTARVFRAQEDCTLSGLGEVTHDAPLYAAALFKQADGTPILLLSGVEDRPLDRTRGFFGRLDTTLFAYRLTGPKSTLLWTTPLGELGLVNVKRLLLEGHSQAPNAVVALAAGSASMARIDLHTGRAKKTIRTGPSDDGVFVGNHWLFTTSSLTDAVTRLERSSLTQDQHLRLPSSDRPRHRMVALGEALILTSLMTQRPRADGMYSQVSCESCHHQLSVDGRTHFTGRMQGNERVVATTRTLFGLLQARPHFSRALDRTSTMMIDHEFGVMAAGTDGSAHFSFTVDEHPWLEHLGFSPDDVITGHMQREAVLRFLASATPPLSPVRRVRKHSQSTVFTPQEAAGADLFAARCAGCHAPRVLLDDASTTVDRAHWAEHLFGDRPSLVWAREGYEKTNVTPYVHPQGARPSPLFGLSLKRPLLTTGEAKTLRDLLDQVRIDHQGFLHRPRSAQGQQGALTHTEKEALLSFLQLL